MTKILPKFNSVFRGNYIAGQFGRPMESSGEWRGKSPADLTDETAHVIYSYQSIDEAVTSARAAFKKWRNTSTAERAEFLKRYQAALKRRADELAEMMAREVGKPLWEAKTEVTSMVNKVDITLTDSAKLVADYEIPGILEGTVGATRYRPHGVMAVVGPFNFPGHLANGHIVPALLTGNVVIFKPSEKSPLVGQLMAECLHEAGIPSGVFSLVQGEKEVGRRLCVHEGVDGILFTGSYEVGMRIKQDTLQQHWKILALEMGGKNATVVWEDADLDHAVHETLLSAYLTTGQRCSATSRVLVHRKLLDAFIARFHERAKAFSIGHPLENPFMGPLIDAGSVDRYLKFLGIASREGAEVVMRGKQLELDGLNGHYVAPSICVIRTPSLEATRKSVYQQNELFAPNVAILGVDEVEEAVAQVNATQFGLVASVFTRDRRIYDRMREDLEVGLVNWNKATVGASSRLPFGGLKKSGNHFPTAVTATQYCALPVASLESAEARFNPSSPGLNWK